LKADAKPFSSGKADRDKRTTISIRARGKIAGG
jgi:hypothetical protein